MDDSRASRIIPYGRVVLNGIVARGSSPGVLSNWPIRPAKLLKRSAETVPAAWKVATTGSPVLRRSARTAPAFSGLLASRPSESTGRCALLMIFAASTSDSWLPGPKCRPAGTSRASHFAPISITSFGKFTYAAPGRSDSATGSGASA